MAGDEDIDLDSLQAQIDLSMSYTHDLVSSWFTPSTSTSSSSTSKRVEKEIFEQMRLPPRLGVGASISESAAGTSREANKLKSRLLGKKRPRDSEDGASKLPSDNSDDEESRAGAIKKKPRTDPFADGGKSKGKKNKPASLSIPQPKAVKGTSPVPTHPSATPSTPSKPKEAQPIPPTPQEEAEVTKQLIIPSAPPTPKKAHFSLSITSPIIGAEKAAGILTTPVLNLDGPVESEGDEEDHPAIGVYGYDTGDESPWVMIPFTYRNISFVIAALLIGSEGE
ncbi:hypothetical protein BDZ89DRAFT_1133605 [Hymenopellis radicata]|nr:hypothetical protein BDZ89DRAFT_1133605 [Hymenopellis radicata]